MIIKLINFYISQILILIGTTNQAQMLNVVLKHAVLRVIIFQKKIKLNIGVLLLRVIYLIILLKQLLNG